MFTVKKGTEQNKVDGGFSSMKAGRDDLRSLMKAADVRSVLILNFQV